MGLCLWNICFESWSKRLYADRRFSCLVSVIHAAAFDVMLEVSVSDSVINKPREYMTCSAEIRVSVSVVQRPLWSCCHEARFKYLSVSITRGAILNSRHKNVSIRRYTR